MRIFISFLSFFHLSRCFLLSLGTICSIGFDNFSEHTVNDLSFLNLPKGRTEFIKNIPDNIVIDYAHNEEAIEFILKSLSNYCHFIFIFCFL